MKEAKKQMSDLEQKTYYSHLSRSIKGLIGDKLNLSALAFTPAEIRRCLREQGVRKESVESLHAFLEELEYNQFVSGGQRTGEREEQYNKARKFVALLDKKL